jgi:hypothetical protein
VKRILFQEKKRLLLVKAPFVFWFFYFLFIKDKQMFFVFVCGKEEKRCRIVNKKTKGLKKKKEVKIIMRFSLLGNFHLKKTIILHNKNIKNSYN